MTVAAEVAALASTGQERKHGSYVDADEEYHRRETITAAAAAAAACHRREVPYRRPFVGFHLPRPPPSQNSRPTTRACGFGGSAGAPTAGRRFAILWALLWE